MCQPILEIERSSIRHSCEIAANVLRMVANGEDIAKDRESLLLAAWGLDHIGDKDSPRRAELLYNIVSAMRSYFRVSEQHSLEFVKQQIEELDSLD